MFKKYMQFLDDNYILKLIEIRINKFNIFDYVYIYFFLFKIDLT